MKDDLRSREMNSRQTGRACFTVTAPGDEQFLWSLEAKCRRRSSYGFGI